MLQYISKFKIIKIRIKDKVKIRKFKNNKFEKFFKFFNIYINLYFANNTKEYTIIINSNILIDKLKHKLLIIELFIIINININS